MSATITIEEAQADLKGIIAGLAPGEELVITDREQPIAKLVLQKSNQLPRPAPGLGRGSVLYMSDDFDEPMEEFKEYIE